jgi:hypothetical protein
MDVPGGGSGAADSVYDEVSAEGAGYMDVAATNSEDHSEAYIVPSGLNQDEVLYDAIDSDEEMDC